MADEAAVALKETKSAKNGVVLGGLLIAIVLVVLIPVGVLMSGAIGAGVLGWLLKDTTDKAGDAVWRELND